MDSWQGKRPITVVTACMTREGLPTFAINQVEVTHEEADNGIHYYLVEAELMAQGFEEPYVHFPEMEAPSFLIPAVQQSHELPVSDVSEPALTEALAF